MTPASGPIRCQHYDLVPKDFGANMRFRREMLEMCGRDPAAAAQVWTMCAEDILFYVNVFGWTYSPKDQGDFPLVPFITYAFQDDAIVSVADCLVSGRDCAVPKSRDMGASWIGLSVIEWRWHFQPFQSFLMVSRKQELVDDKGDPVALFWKIDFLHRNQPRWLLPTGRSLGWNDPNRKLMHIGNADNGSVIDGESTTGNLGVGDRRTALFIDEFAAFPTDDGYAVLRGTRDVTNCRIFNSTPRGQNAFYDVVEKTSARKIRLHWSQHPLKNPGMYQTGKDGLVELMDGFTGVVEASVAGEKETRRCRFPEDYPFRLDGKLRSPWYDRQCDRGASLAEIAQELDIDFLGSDYQFFEVTTIEALRKKYARAPLLTGDLEFDQETCEPKRFVENSRGKLRLWLTLDGDGRIALDRKFIMGADVSAGTGASNSVCSLVDKATGEKVAVWRDPNTLPNQFGRFSVALAKFFNRALIVPDRSGPTGEVMVKEVVRQGYGRVYYRRIEKKVGRTITDEPGVFLNPSARTTLLEDYRDALGTHKFVNRSDNGLLECLQFIRKQDGTIEHSAAANAQDPSGARTAHGDEVIADALCNLGLSDTESHRCVEEPEVPMGSLAWRQKQRRDDLLKAGSDKLGAGW